MTSEETYPKRYCNTRQPSLSTTGFVRGRALSIHSCSFAAGQCQSLSVIELAAIVLKPFRLTLCTALSTQSLVHSIQVQPAGKATNREKASTFFSSVLFSNLSNQRSELILKQCKEGESKLQKVPVWVNDLSEKGGIFVGSHAFRAKTQLGISLETAATGAVGIDASLVSPSCAP